MGQRPRTLILTNFLFSFRFLRSTRQLLPAQSQQQHRQRLLVEPLHVTVTTAHDKPGRGQLQFVHCQWSRAPSSPPLPLTVLSSAPHAPPAERNTGRHVELSGRLVVHARVRLPGAGRARRRQRNGSAPWSQQAEEAKKAEARDGREEEEPRGLHHLLVGVPAEAAAGPRVLPPLHQVDQPRQGRLQARRLQGRVQVVGNAQEQAGHELRDDGPRAALLLPARHPRQSRRPAPRLSVRRCSKRHNRD